MTQLVSLHYPFESYKNERSYLVNLLPALEVLGANHSMVMQQCLKINQS
jgi:hypothetical protein